MYTEPTDLERAVIKAELSCRCEYEIVLGFESRMLVTCGKRAVGHDLETEQARCERHIEA